MLRDERRGPRVVRQTGNGARPYALTHLDRGADEVEDRARLRVHARRGVFDGPAAIMLSDGAEDRVATRMRRERQSVRHDRPGEMRVVWLGDEQEAVADASND